MWHVNKQAIRFQPVLLWRWPETSANALFPVGASSDVALWCPSSRPSTPTVPDDIGSLAVLAAATAPDVSLVGISTVQGIVEADDGAYFARRAAKHLALNVPIMKGGPLPAAGTHEFPANVRMPLRRGRAGAAPAAPARQAPRQARLGASCAAPVFTVRSSGRRAGVGAGADRACCAVSCLPLQ